MCSLAVSFQPSMTLLMMWVLLLLTAAATRAQNVTRVCSSNEDLEQCVRDFDRDRSEAVWRCSVLGELLAPLARGSLPQTPPALAAILPPLACIRAQPPVCGIDSRLRLVSAQAEAPTE